MRRKKGVLQYATSEGEVVFGTSQEVVANYFSGKENNFTCMFSGDRLMIEKEEGIYVSGRKVKRVGRGVYKYCE